MYTTHEEFRAAIQAVITNTDFGFAALKAHKLDNPDNTIDPKTGKVEQIDGPESYITVQTRMPREGITFLGKTVYPNTAQVKIDLFKLSAKPGMSVTPGASAATLSADSLEDRLAKAEQFRIEQAAIAAAAKALKGKFPAGVVVVPASEVPPAE
jgi:hypothetical protein